MNPVWITVGGVAVHVLSLALAQYAQWLLTKVADGEVRFGFRADLRAFVQQLLRGLAGWFCGRSSPHDLAGYEDDLQPGYFSAR